MNSRRLRGSTWLIVCVASTFAGLGCGGATDEAQRNLGASTTQVTTESATPPPQATEEQRALVSRILSGLGESSIARVEFTRAPDGFEEQGSARSWVSVTVASYNDPVQRTHSYWEALLLIGALRDLSHAQGLPAIVGKTITTVYPDGRTEHEGDSVIDQPFRHAIAASDVDMLENVVEQGSLTARAHVKSVRFLRPAGHAIEVELTTTEAAKFVADRSRRLHDVLGEGRLIDPIAPLTEGTYVEVRDEAGKIVTVSAYATRMGEGAGWTRPDLRQPTELGPLNLSKE